MTEDRHDPKPAMTCFLCSHADTSSCAQGRERPCLIHSLSFTLTHQQMDKQLFNSILLTPSHPSPAASRALFFLLRSSELTAMPMCTGKVSCCSIYHRYTSTEPETRLLSPAALSNVEILFLMFFFFLQGCFFLKKFLDLLFLTREK